MNPETPELSFVPTLPYIAGTNKSPILNFLILKHCRHQDLTLELILGIIEDHLYYNHP